MSSKLLLPDTFGGQAAKTALHVRAEQQEKGKLRSFAIVTLDEDGKVDCDFDIQLNGKGQPSLGDVNALGAGVRQLYDHLRAIAAQNIGQQH